MSDDQVSIEVDGQTLQARKGAMLIEATDAANIYIPRFCYHEKLSIAANCRMCLVEVEKAPKPLPACATPVTEGMKVRTRSELAKDAQKSTMEFLLINHPLDCPICDQGGECELQDLAMGYGGGVSRYTEGKRVVRDKDIGPLVQTDLTRCIHCTRCVRFGEEIAGLRELGATGRGEDMEIGTYVEKAMVSEMSGNVIDLCPVGALTSKPFRFSARAWELRQFDSIAPHDSVGSNVHIHVMGNIVKRVVPKNNEAINEVWISDRDRYSYEGLYSDERLTVPMIKQEGQWQETDWETALQFAVSGLQALLDKHGAQQLGALANANSTLEELYLLQKFMRGLGSGNIDHRLWQSDFSDQGHAPCFPWLGQSLADLERIDAALLIGSNLRKDQPLINHRLRKAGLRGAQLMVINPLAYDFNWPIAEQAIVPITEMPSTLAGVYKRLCQLKGVNYKDLGGLQDDGAAEFTGWLDGIAIDAAQQAMAVKLHRAGRCTVLLGNLATAHPMYGTLNWLARCMGELDGVNLGYLPAAANTCGAWLAGVLPHRGPAGQDADSYRLNAKSMMEVKLKGYLLLNVEPELDSINPKLALRALGEAEFVAVLTAFVTPRMQGYADVLLPIAQFAETSGTYVNCLGAWQSFTGAVKPPGEVRPAWKVLRVLGNRCQLEGFDYISSEDVKEEIAQLRGNIVPDNTGKGWTVPSVKKHNGTVVQLVSELPCYAADPLVRRATALQATPDIADGKVHISTGVAAALGLQEGDRVRIKDGEDALPVTIDERLGDDTALIHGGQDSAINLNLEFRNIELVNV